MSVLIIIFGSMILIAGLAIIINPDLIFGYLRRNHAKPRIHITAVVVRLIIGALLITQSSLSRFPSAIEILGWVSIVAAVLIAVMGRGNFQSLISRALNFLKPFGRVGGVLAASFGAFLIYSFV